MSFITDLEAKLADIENQIKTHSGYVTDIATTVEKLLGDKSTSIANVNILNGAKQAYADVLNVAKAGIPAIEAVAPQATSVIDEVLPVIEAVAPIIEAVL